MISKDELLQGRDKTYASEYTQEISDNLDTLLVALNNIRVAYGKPMTCNSGWRPAAINGSTPGAATHSKHMIGLACDFADVDGEIMRWALNNLQLLKDNNLYMEDFRWTPTWTHMGYGPPASGKRIFVPSAARPTAPSRWNGDYDHSFDDK